MHFAGSGGNSPHRVFEKKPDQEARNVGDPREVTDETPAWRRGGGGGRRGGIRGGDTGRVLHDKERGEGCWASEERDGRGGWACQGRRPGLEMGTVEKGSWLAPSLGLVGWGGQGPPADRYGLFGVCPGWLGLV